MARKVAEKSSPTMLYMPAPGKVVMPAVAVLPCWARPNKLEAVLVKPTWRFLVTVPSTPMSTPLL